jgi:ATPase subunit of ABC transporter with duplicated ATPase domains
MAHLLNAEAVTVIHGARTLLDAVSLGMDDGDRVGVVGRNGEGKSTLLRVLARRQEPDSGRVTHGRDLRLGALWQDDSLPAEQTVRQAVLGELADHEWAAVARVRDVLTGLLGGLDAEAVGGLDATFGRLSGGQRRRVGLAKLLIEDHDLVMLDEPTNHLDVEGVAWLAEHLRGRWPAGRGGLVVVTHDRWFLDAVCERIWEVHDGVVEAYDGGYAAYVLTRAERSRVAAVTEERRQNTLRKELAWLQRGAPARTSKPRFRIDAAVSLIENEPPPRDQMSLSRMATARLGKDVIDLENVTVAVGSGDERRVLFDDVTWRLGPGDRIGLVGVNGSGKTTLLRMMAGTPDAAVPGGGRVKRGKTVRTALLSQDVRELSAVAGMRVQEAVESVRGSIRIGDKDVTAGQLLERLGFTKEKIWTQVADLSGGERRRLQLLRLLMSEPNVLLLDEPTNDLDTDTLAAIEDTLDEWPGTLIVVSHDRYLLERIADKQLALLGDGKIRDLPGGVEEYLTLRSASIRAASGVAAPKSSAARAGDPAAGPSQGELRAARKELARLERQISKLTAREQKLHAQMAEQATDHTAVLTLDTELRALVAERESLEEAWLEAAEIAEG